MKRNTKRLPALLLAILLCLSLLPGTALAVPGEPTEIQNITLEIDRPTASGTPDDDVQAGLSDNFSVDSYNGCTWYQVSGPGETEPIKWLREGDTFTNNSWYLVELYLIAGYGYQFTERTALTVPGAEQTAIEPSEGGEQAWALVWFRVGNEPPQTGTIDSIAVTGVPIPTAGQTVEDAHNDSGWDDIELPVGIGNCQLVRYNLWDSEDSRWYSPWHTGNEKFSTAETYRVVLDLFAADGYTFNETISTVTVNGQNAYILEQGKGYAQVMLMFTPGESAATYRGYVEISYAEVISAVWPVEGMTIPKDQGNFTVSSEYYALKVAKWQRNVGTGADSYWSDLTEGHEADSIFYKTQYRIYAEVSVAAPWARFGSTVNGSINGTIGTDETVSDNGETCVLTREVAVYDAVYAYPSSGSGKRDYDGVPLSINTPAAEVEATVGYYGKKDAWESVDGLSACYTDWYEVPRVGSTYTLKRLMGASESQGTSGDHFEAGKVYLLEVDFRSQRYNSSGYSTFRENFEVQGIYDRETGEKITPDYMEQTVNDRHQKVYNFWFTTGEATETPVTDIAVKGPELNSPEDLEGLVYGSGGSGSLTDDALKWFSCEQLTATFGYAYANDDGSWIVSLTLEVKSGYYLDLQQKISATYNGDDVPFQVASWDPYDEGYITITIFAGKPVSVQKAGASETTEHDTLEAAVSALGSDKGTITLRRSYTLEKDAAAITVPGTATLVIPDGMTLTVPDGKTLELANPAFLDNSKGSIAVASGGTLKIPDSKTQMTAFVGADNNARIRLTSGTLTLDMGEDLLTLGANAVAEIPENQEAWLLQSTDGTTKTPLDAVIETGAVLTVKGTLNAISGTDRSGSTLTVKGTLDASDGTLSVAMYAKVAVEQGGKVTLSPASLLSGKVLGKADIAAGGSVSVGNEEWIGTGGNVNLTAGRMTLDFGGITSGTIAAALTGNARAAVPTGKRWTLKVGQGDKSANVNLAVETGSTLAVAGEFHVANNSTLTVDGAVDITGHLSIGSAGTVTGIGSITNQGILTLDKGETVGKLDVGVTLKNDGKAYTMTDITNKLTNAEELENKTYNNVEYAFAWAAKEPAEPIIPDEPPVTPVEPVNPGGSSGGSEDDGYSVSVPASSSIRGGSITVSPRSADKGDTVTITATPDEGYELDELTVATRSGGELTLTSKGGGRYTFTMPASDVKIQVSFREIAAPAVNPFIDVSAGAYYYDAVLWAVENGVTNGTTATTFSPDATVTRAQMVTFLWRAHGAPRADGANPFTDVSAGAYYYDAVLWAVASGITNGTTATTFSPDAPVTRAQAVTFQWRAAGAPALSGESFGDVAADAYYAGAVTWAVANGITKGTGGNKFSPEVTVTRAQAVTFLWRELA